MRRLLAGGARDLAISAASVCQVKAWSRQFVARCERAIFIADSSMILLEMAVERDLVGRYFVILHGTV
jgi:hypothetical protein